MPNETEVLLTIFGFALASGGWAIFHLGTRLIGVTIGLGFGFGFGYLLAMVLQLTGNVASLIEMACALLGAFGGLLLVRAVTNFAFGATGFLFGALLGRLASEMYLQSQGQPFAFTQDVVLGILASAIAVGLLALWLKRLIIILVTSYVGATFLTAGVPWLEQSEPTSVLAVFLIAVAWQSFLAGRLLSGGGKRAESEK